MTVLMSLNITRPGGAVWAEEAATLESEIVALLSGLGYAVTVATDVYGPPWALPRKGRIA